MGKKEEIGRNIRLMRNSRQMTQMDLARAIGQSPSSITMYETGRREPDIETLEALADVFNVPLSTIIPDKSSGFPQDLPVTQEARILAKGIDKFPKAQREQALNIIKAVFTQYADYFNEEDNNAT